MFNWLDYANKKDVRFERIAWLKITGVPLLAWDEDNFASIAGQFGKVISQDNVLFTCSDISFGKVGIITAHRKKINEEIVGSLNGKSFRIGIVELDEEWYPFKPFSPYRPVESDDDKDDDDGYEEEDGISDTFELPPEDLEDGEIDQNQPAQQYYGSPIVPIQNDTSPTMEVEETPREDNSKNSNALFNAFIQHVLNATECKLDKIPNEPVDKSISLGSSNDMDANVGQHKNGPDINGDSYPLDSPNFASDGSRIKRRKIKRSHSRFQPYGRPSPHKNTQPLPNQEIESEPSIDLNRCVPPGNDLQQHEPESRDSYSTTNEIAETVAVGNELGFQIVECDGAFRQAFNRDGDARISQ